MGALVLSSMVLVANVSGAIMVLPQVLRLRRGAAVEGVSAVWAGVGVALNAWWVIYGVSRGIWAIVPVTTIGAVLYGVICAQFVRISGTAVWRSVMLGVVTLGMVPLPALLAGGWRSAGVALGVSYALQFVPAAWTAIDADRLEGVSATTWMLAWIEAVVWFAYGLAVADPALAIGGAGGGAMATLILACLVRRSDRHERVTPVVVSR